MKRRQSRMDIDQEEDNLEMTTGIDATMLDASTLASSSSARREPSMPHVMLTPSSSSASSTARSSGDGPPSMRKLLYDRASSSNGMCGMEYYHRKALRRALHGPLDRVNVLGDDNSYGHRGCVNALSWALNGEVLISGGDDTTIRLWRLDRNETSKPYPYKCDSVIYTGHTGNIFNAHLLPSSTKIATVAGDRQVRVFDVERALTTSSQGRETEFTTGQTLVCELRCHYGRTKRIVTEESSDSFLTVAEDGTVRQHDLRVPHRCRRGNCPQPLVKLPFDLSALALSPLAPYQFVVAGESQYGYLFDRRQVGRTIQAEWGVPPDSEDYVTCVRRFGRETRGQGEAPGSEHVTGARMAQTNSYEILLSYSGDAVYLYSTRDDPHEPTSPSSVLSPNAKKQKTSHASSEQPSVSAERDQQGGDPLSGPDPRTDSAEQEEGEDLHDILEILRNPPQDEDERDSSDDNDENEEEENEYSGDLSPAERRLDAKFRTPVIMPRRRFFGHRNIETVKDVNFIGPEDELVASGSDGGHFFLWDKETGKVHGIYEGDGSVVNVIECHPRLPLIACSGIDTTVKLFAPTFEQSKFSRMNQVDEIVRRNSSMTRQSLQEQYTFARLFLRYRAAMRRAAEAGSGSEDSDGDPRCTFQ